MLYSRQNRPSISECVSKSLSGRLALLLLFCFALLAPAQAKPTMTIIDTRTGKAVTQTVLLDRLAAADVVFVGEQHTDLAAHAFELAVLTGLQARVGPRLTLGLEMFERDVQPMLDDYLHGKTTEAAFLKTSRPWSNYTADYHPLVEFARAHAVPVLASNVPQTLATAVGRRGLPALSEFPPAQYAPDVQTPHDSAFTRFQAVMQDMGGAHGGMDAATIARFYDAQCLRDATMAASITRRLQAAPNTLLLHINGQFHSDYGEGIPRRVLWQGPLTRCVVISVLGDAKAPPDSKELADYVVLAYAPR